MSKIKSLRKVLAGIMAMAVVFGGMTIDSSLVSKKNEVSAALAGDLDSSGTVDSDDVEILQEYLTKKGTIADSISADLNNDNKINVFDLITLKRIAISTSVSSVNYIHLNGDTISIEGDNMELSETNNVVTITAGGTYQIDGTLTDGQIYVNAGDEDKVNLIMNGVDVTCSTNAPIYVVNADKTVITLAEGTENILNDTELYTDAEADSTIYSKDDLTIKGSGSLTVNSNYLYSITSNDDLKINGGNITVKHNSVDTSGAAIKGKKSVVIKDGNLKVTCAADDADDGADGIISNDSTDGYIEISGGTVNVNSKGGDAIKSKKNYISITGGTVTAKAENDALQAETSLSITGGDVKAYGKRSLTTGTDYAPSITGGSVVATSNEEIADTSAISVNSMLLGYTEKIDKQEISIKKNGTEVYNITPNKKYTYALICNESLTNGTYTVYTGETQMTHDSATVQGEFVKSGTLASFSGVAAMSGSTVEPTGDNTITLSNSGITFSGSGATISADLKTITISQPGTYSVSGEMSEGQIVVDVDKTTYSEGLVELDLVGMTLSNSSDSPVYVEQIGDEVQIVAKKGYTNTISDGTSYTNADESMGAIYSRDDLKIKGSGNLVVNGNGADAIVCKNDLKIYNGNITVNAADDCIRGKDSVTIGNESDTDFSSLILNLTAKGGDGIKSNAQDEATSTKTYGAVDVNGGTINITAYGDGIQAAQLLNINGGTIDIETTGSRDTGSSKGLKGGYTDDDTNTTSIGTVNVNGGFITLNTGDDGINSNGDVNMLGGETQITVKGTTTGYQGIHADATVNLGSDNQPEVYDDMTLIVYSAYEGVEAYDINQKSGTTIVNSVDDGFNVSGGADNSGSSGGWPGQGGGMGGGSTATAGDLTFTGGFSLVSVQDGDHDGYDSNGNIYIKGGICVTNGCDAFDWGDNNNTISYTGGVYVKNIGAQMSMGGGMGGMGGSSSSITESVNVSTSVSAGTRVTLCDGSGNVIVSFIADKTCSSLVAGCTAYSNASFYTGGTLSGSTYFQELDDTQLAAYGGTLSGGTQVTGSSSSDRPW